MKYWLKGHGGPFQRRSQALKAQARFGGRIVRVYTADEARDRRAAAVLIEEAKRLLAGTQPAYARHQPRRLIAARLLRRAEGLSHCPCKGPDEDPGPHSRCCPLRDPDYIRDEEAF
jgi:hypothetical protein